jgi:hypothetical protein
MISPRLPPQDEEEAVDLRCHGPRRLAIRLRRGRRRVLRTFCPAHSSTRKSSAGSGHSQSSCSLYAKRTGSDQAESRATWML